MKVRYITEKEFVPMTITHARRHNEVEDGLFQIVYGVMRPVPIIVIYDLIVRLSKEQISETVKRFMLSTWKVEVEAILTKLNSYDTENFRVVVIIPFNDYIEDISHTITRFQLVLFTINEILEKGDSQMTTLPENSFIIKSKSIQDLLEVSYVEHMKLLLPEDIKAKSQLYRCLFFDEMIRRGMITFKIDEPIVDPDTDEVICSQEYVKLAPSQYFNQPEKFFEIMEYYKTDEWKKLTIKSELEEPNDSNNDAGSKSTSKLQDYRLGTVGTVFFMLKDLSQEAIDKKNKKKLVALMNYILDNNPGDDTARSYLDKLFEITAKSHAFKFYNSVKTNLRRLGFDVPKVIKEGWENKQK